MSDEWLSDDERQLLERAAKCIASARLTLIDAASAHVHMGLDERPLDERQRAAAEWWLERLSAVLGEVEELGLDALGDDLLPEDAVALLGDLEESFLLALSTDAGCRSQVLTSRRSLTESSPFTRRERGTPRCGDGRGALPIPLRTCGPTHWSWRR